MLLEQENNEQLVNKVCFFSCYLFILVSVVFLLLVCISLTCLTIAYCKTVEEFVSRSVVFFVACVAEAC